MYSSSIYTAFAVGKTLWASVIYSLFHLTYKKGNVIFKKKKEKEKWGVEKLCSVCA